MAKLARKTLIQFGKSGASTNFGEFGSKKAGVPNTTQDPAVIQDLTAWVNGWQDAVVTANKAAYLEDMNGWCYVHSYMTAYIFQMGIPEWDSTTIYFINSVVQDAAGNGQWFKSLQDNNTGNTPPVGASNAWWKWVNPSAPVDSGLSVNSLPKASSVSPGATLVDSNVTDDGVNVAIALPLKFPDNTIQSTATTSIANQNVLTGSRALGTVFHNAGTKPLFVSVTAFTIPGGGGQMEVFTDASATPTTSVAKNAMFDDGTNYNIFFIVLPGNYYKVTQTNSSLVTWTEWS